MPLLEHTQPKSFQYSGGEEEEEKERNVGSRKRREVIYPLPTPPTPTSSFQMSGIIESLLENIGKQPPASYLILRLAVWQHSKCVYVRK